MPRERRRLSRERPARSAIERSGGQPRMPKFSLDRHGRRGKRRFDVAVVERRLEEDIAAVLVQLEGVLGASVEGINQRGKGLQLELDQLARVLGPVGVLRYDYGDGLAREAHHVFGEKRSRWVEASGFWIAPVVGQREISSVNTPLTPGGPAHAECPH